MLRSGAISSSAAKSGMPKSNSELRRLKGLTVNFFAANIALGYRVVRQVDAALAMEKLALKKWRDVWHVDGSFLGVMPAKPAEHKTLNQVLIERLIAVTITNGELRRNAGLYGRSRTAGLTEWQRARRRKWRKGVPLEDGGEGVWYRTDEIADPEDATERAVEKVRQWPFPASLRGADKEGNPIFGDKAVRVYPHAPKTQTRAAELRRLSKVRCALARARAEKAI